LDPRRGASDPGGFLRYSHLGIQLAICVALPFYVGHRLDERWGTSPLLALLGCGLGFAAGFLTLYRGVYGWRDRSKD
jgi:F0F1-type ATP synthase assembly protein I